MATICALSSSRTVALTWMTMGRTSFRAGAAWLDPTARSSRSGVSPASLAPRPVRRVRLGHACSLSGLSPASIPRRSISARARQRHRLGSLGFLRHNAQQHASADGIMVLVRPGLLDHRHHGRTPGRLSAAKTYASRVCPPVPARHAASGWGPPALLGPGHALNPLPRFRRVGNESCSHLVVPGTHQLVASHPPCDYAATGGFASGGDG